MPLGQQTVASSQTISARVARLTCSASTTPRPTWQPQLDPAVRRPRRNRTRRTRRRAAEAAGCSSRHSAGPFGALAGADPGLVALQACGDQCRAVSALPPGVHGETGASKPLRGVEQVEHLGVVVLGLAGGAQLGGDSPSSGGHRAVGEAVNARGPVSRTREPVEAPDQHWAEGQPRTEVAQVGGGVAQAGQAGVEPRVGRAAGVEVGRHDDGRAMLDLEVDGARHEAPAQPRLG